jgi:hypothetical protein
MQYILFSRICEARLTNNKIYFQKLTLQDLLNKSKDECHRINEMYSTRQSALLEENESLRTDHADLSARQQDQDEFMQQIIKEKVSIVVSIFIEVYLVFKHKFLL